MNPSDPSAERLFEAVRHLATVEQRSAFLQIACGKDLEVRRRVDALLEAAAQKTGPIEDPGPRLADSTCSEETAIARVPFTKGPGDRIGRYKLLQQIGEGGCGVVYLAEQEEPVRRRVALKVIKLGMDTRQVIARFEAERQALALMDHPNIAKVFDAGATDKGRPFFVMELVRGVKFTDYCEQNNLSTADRLKLFTLVCQAIQHAHQKGIIHRDIKPSNILVTLHDGVPVPKVIDFGIAKATTNQRLTDQTLFTALEQFVGTPAYMSPEQAEMSGLDIDTRTDIYSLGVLLYELLTGRTPFDSRELLAAGFDAMRHTIRNQEPVRPSTRLSTLLAGELTEVARRQQSDPPKLISLLRGDLDWIVMKTLEKDRTRRYETANDLARDIQRYLNNEPVIARPPSTLYRFQKLVRRNQVAAAAVGAVTAALLLGLGLSSWLLWRERQARRAAVAAQLKADAQAAKSQQVAAFLQDMLNGVGPSVAQGRDTTMLREILDKTADRLDKDLKDQPAVAAELQSTIGEVYLALGNYAKARLMFAQALELQRKLLGNEHPSVAAALINLARVSQAQGRFGEAESMIRQALAMQGKQHGNEHADMARSLNDLALVLELQGRLPEAESAYRQALAMQRKLFGNQHRAVAATLNNLATVLKNEGNFAEAETMHREALEMKRKLLGNEHPAIAISLVNLAMAQENQGKFAEAETTVREALELRRKVLGSEHPAVANSLDYLAEVLTSEGKFDQAEATALQALRLATNLFGLEHPAVAEALRSLAAVLAAQNKSVKAETTIRQALSMQRKLVGNDHPDVALSLATLAPVLERQGKLTEAETDIGQALQIQEKVLGNRHLEVANSLNECAEILFKQSRFVEAERAARQALDIRANKLPTDWRTFDSRSVLGACLAGQRKFVAAETLLISSLEGLHDQQRLIPAQNKPLLKQALVRVVELYTVMGQPDKATQWKKRYPELLAPN